MSDPKIETGAAPSIYKRLCDISRELRAVAKDQKNPQQGFLYRGLEGMMNELHPLFAKHGVIVVPECGEHKMQERTTARGGTMLHHLLEMQFTLIAEDGTNFKTPRVWGEVMESGDKGVGKAMSYALKKVLEILFTLPTKDEADAEAPEVGAPAARRETMRMPKASPRMKEILKGVAHAKFADDTPKEEMDALMDFARKKKYLGQSQFFGDLTDEQILEFLSKENMKFEEGK